MRFYDIQITDTQGGPITRRYTSFVNGQTDPGALMVEMDVTVASMHQPAGNAFVRVWGVSLQDIAQASNLNNKFIKVLGGMKAGLPLANPQQSGLLFEGQINQAFGNWQDTNQSLDMLLIAAPPVSAAPDAQFVPLNLSLNWEKGSALSTAIAAVLSTALPGYTQKISISPRLVFPESACGFYESLTQFATMLNRVSKSIIGGAYPGVQISIQGSTVNVWDTTTPPGPKKINFVDLIGQITWSGPAQLNVKCVMRADIDVGDLVTLPPGQITTTAASLSQFRTGSVFQGTYFVQSVRHVGNSRQPDANAWVTIFDVFSSPQAAS